MHIYINLFSKQAYSHYLYRHNKIKKNIYMYIYIYIYRERERERERERFFHGK